MADVTDSVLDEADEDGFEEVGLDYSLKSRHCGLQGKGNVVIYNFYEPLFL